MGERGLFSCRLLLANLMGFVKNKFAKDAYFDYKEFNKEIYDKVKNSFGEYILNPIETIKLRDLKSQMWSIEGKNLDINDLVFDPTKITDPNDVLFDFEYLQLILLLDYVV